MLPPRAHATLCLRLESWPKASYFFTKECVRPHAAYAAVVVVHVLILLSTLVSTLPQSPPARSAGENLRLVRARAPSTVGDGGSRAAQG